MGRLVLAAPAIKVANPLLPVAPLLALFLRRVRWPLRPEREEVADPDWQAMAREYWSRRFVPQSASLRRRPGLQRDRALGRGQPSETPPGPGMSPASD